ncbi:hypothetical protein K7W42_22310 [Deinococcus sp. HMF7604]|uniref:hypothetical protein n=1 Tax=Deinococcus betulae TaxID=2873312 RepID=UPI001CCCB235|nr:hypothetical protein [Deinococcus betulae]MBZ9753569.1 hypothetical protein [Deinococcus betulae]
MDLQLLSGLGLPGLLFLVAFVLAQIALVELVKVVLARAGQVLQGLTVIGLSALLGLALGWLLLQGVAGAAGIELARPWRGMALGLVLGLIASGWVSYRSRQNAAKGVPTDVLAEMTAVLAQVAAAQASTLPVPAPAIQEEELRPMDAEDVLRATGEWPAVPGLDEAPLDRGHP